MNVAIFEFIGAVICGTLFVLLMPVLMLAKLKKMNEEDEIA